jgi:hypothetical protein
MSGFYDDASWVLIPEGIKEDVVYAQKPTDGLGDLTFTRASDATRTNSAGVIERTPWNLFQSSEMFSDAYWTKESGSIGINAVVAPNGTLTADKLIDGVSSASLLRGIPTTVQAYSFSLYAQKAERNSVNLSTSYGGATFNLETGVASSVSGGITPASTNVGGGWWRVSISFNATVATPNFRIITAGTGTIVSGTSGIYIWGAQLVEGTDAKPYFATTNRQDVPRLDYRNADGSLNSCPRLLLEPQRTNSIRNSTMVGAVAGSPGTLPTNWVTFPRGLTQTIVATGTINGLSYIDLRFVGTSVGNTLQIFPDAITQIVAAMGQTWTGSIWVQVLSQPSPAPSYNLVVTERTATGSGLAGSTTPFDTSFNRLSVTRTLTNILTERISLAIHADTVNGATYDFTIRIAAPQMELGATASTFIPTTTAAVTRLADLASKTGVSSLIGQTEGTLFAEVYISQLQGAVARTLIDIGSTNNRIFVGFTGEASNTMRLQIDTSLNTARVDFRAVIASVGTIKVAAAYKNGDCALYVNGVAGTQVVSTSFSFTTLANLVVGQTISGTALLNDSIAQAALFKTRLTNAQLVTLTT